MFKISVALLAIAVGVALALAPSGQPRDHAKRKAAVRGAVDRPEPILPQPEIATATISSVALPAQIAGTTLDRASLTQTLQRELKRVGCYQGEINGVWTDSTREAMKAFTELANARLPVSEPDQVLLALIKGSQGKTCKGNAVAARSMPKPPTTLIEPADPLPGPPMALAGPKATDVDDAAAVAAKAKKAPKRGITEARRPVRDNHWTVNVWKNTPN
jgi:peptidoglycan hydrolase-like protein with peptidoglycan-binding domain